MKIIILVAILFPSIALAQSNTYTFTLNWQDNSSAPAAEEGFLIYRDGTQVGKVGSNITTYKDQVTGTVGNPVCYEVTSYNHQYADGTGNLQEAPKSNKACMPMPAGVVKVPAAASGLTVSALSQTSIQLSWAKNSSDETGFEIRREEFNPSNVSAIALPSNITTYVDASLSSQKTYCYNVKAKGLGSDSLFSNQSCATTK